MNLYTQTDDQLPDDGRGYGQDHYGAGGDDCFVDGSGIGKGEGEGRGSGGEGLIDGDGGSWSGFDDGNGGSRQSTVPLVSSDIDDWICWSAEQELG